jgi:multidrug efflux pump subunit AcrA (membrane-fusion protein)
MKRTIIITISVIVGTLILLGIFNKVVSKKNTNILFAETIQGDFEISVTTSGELVAENSIEIKAPEITQERDIHATSIKIQDLVPEGTEVKEGDYIATLDRTEFDNNLKDGIERLATFKTNIEIKTLDTAVMLTNLRDEIRNQIQNVEEAAITLQNSKYEPPSAIRQAEIDLDKQKRILEQRERTYLLRSEQAKNELRHLNMWFGRGSRRVKDFEEILAGFVIKAPAPGMVIYKKDRRGNKIKTGSSISTFERVVATLPDLSSMLSKIYVSEIEISKVKTGQKVNINVDAFPEKTYNGEIMSVANIGEKLPNTDSKVFEVMIRIEGSDPALRPSMTTGNKIIIKTFKDVIFIPTECVHTGADGIPFVYTKNGTKQIIIPGDSNEKNIIIEKGLKPGTIVYLSQPENYEDFKFHGEEFIPLLTSR